MYRVEHSDLKGFLIVLDEALALVLSNLEKQGQSVTYHREGGQHESQRQAR